MFEVTKDTVIADATPAMFIALGIFIVAFICMMIIPGHIINRKAKLQR